MKSSILQGARLNHQTNVYINEYLTQKRSALLYKLRVISINFVSSRQIILQLDKCTPEMVQSTYYMLHSDKNKHYIVNKESDLAVIKSENNDASQQLTSCKKTTEQLATSSKQ